MEMMAALPSLLGAGGSIANMINGSPASHVQPGMNPLQFTGSVLPAAQNMGLAQVGAMPNIYSQMLPQYGDAVSQYFQNNPGAAGMIGGANSAASLGTGAAGNISGLGNFLSQMGTSLMPWFNNMLQQGSVQNPNTGSLMQGAQGVSQLGSNVAGNAFNTGNAMVGAGQSLFPAAGQIYSQGQSLLPGANTLFSQGQSFMPAANSILNASFDPQSALYDRTRHQVEEQTNANLASRGLNMSPFGAGLANKATSDFNIDWQNNQLQRMATGAQGANSLFGNVLGGAAGAGNLFGQTLGAANTAGNLTGQGGSLMSGGSSVAGTAPGMLSMATAAPYQAGSTVLSDILRNLTTGGQGAGMLMDQSGRDITGAASLMGQAPGLMAQSSMMPYQAFNTIGGNILGALGQYGGYGMAATQQPQQQFQDFAQLLGLGNQGAQVGNNMFNSQLNQAQMGFNQNQVMGQNFGNSMAGLGKAFGSNPFASGGAGGSGNGNLFPSASFMSNGMGWG